MVKKKKSSQFLRSCIFEALMILLQQKRYEEITVSEIANKAGVSRMTYYRTYSSK
ncbi:TetR/AcrR family transcriptional regulator, partial [Dubosiella newyorkensis]